MTCIVFAAVVVVATAAVIEAVISKLSLRFTKLILVLLHSSSSSIR